MVRPPHPQGAALTYTLRFQNTPGRAGDGGARRALWAMERGRPAAYGLSEASHVYDDLGASGYRLARGSDAATPYFVRPTVAVTGTREQRAYPDTPVGSWGAGPATLKAAWDRLVRLDDGETEPVWWGCVHLAPSVTRPARTEAAHRARDRRRALHATEVTEVVNVSEGLERVVWMGDWNCPPRYDDVAILRAAGFRICAFGATHHKSPIDWAAVRGVTVVDRRRLPKLDSDHNGIEITIR
jgi:hypothetical protein